MPPRKSAAAVTGLSSRRLAIYRKRFGAPDRVIAGTRRRTIDVCVFGANFAEECEDNDQPGYVLITNGMSDRKMPAARRHPDAPDRAELVWYTADAADEKIELLAWLASLPFVDRTRFGMGHTVHLLERPVEGCKFDKALFLLPIFSSHREMGERVARLIPGDSFELLTVHLLSNAEHRYVNKSIDHFNRFLDKLDDNNYPRRFDPRRRSYI